MMWDSALIALFAMPLGLLLLAKADTPTVLAHAPLPLVLAERASVDCQSAISPSLGHLLLGGTMEAEAANFQPCAGIPAFSQDDLLGHP